MNDINQEKFIKTTLSQIENNLTKFIFETNFSNVQSLFLRSEMLMLTYSMNPSLGPRITLDDGGSVIDLL